MAPKRNHGPKGSASKKPIAPVPGGEHIVFSNDQGPSKMKKAEESPLAPPRPDARKIIGGASWTGKLPVNLLSELCQKQKWNKPDYSMRQLPGQDGAAYRSSVKLSLTNPKTRETTTLPPFLLPRSHEQLADQPTALEARHFAATYTLFRIASMKNIHMTLPPHYRDLWKGAFAQLKEEDVKEGRAWKYDADPFVAEVERQKIHADIEKRKAEAAKRPVDLSSLKMLLPGGGNASSHSRTWERAPKIDMGRKIRTDVEALIKDEMIWNPYGTRMTDTQRDAIVVDLSKSGFRQSHVEEAVQNCKDREETLEWLLIHVPEDDLPPWSFPEGYTAGISLASGDLVKEAKIKRLALAGYAVDDCTVALHAHSGVESLAAESLQNKLVHIQWSSSGELQETESSDVWTIEMQSLEAIFGDRFSVVAEGVCAISSEIDSVPATFQFRRPSSGYPERPPVISILARLPAYIRLSATREAVLFSESLLGAEMMFNLVEWLESNLSRIIEHPGLLRDVILMGSEALISTLEANPGRSGGPQRARIKTRGVGEDGNIRRISSRYRANFSTVPGAAHNASRRQISSSTVSPAMLKQRQSLPAWAKQEEIVHTVSAHQCTIISGETGSGKSTQAVQFLLDHPVTRSVMGNIVCTQPRRVAALSLADRVSTERGSELGKEVGYVIRGDSKVSHETRLTFMTTGVLLRRLNSISIQGTSDSTTQMLQGLEGISHVFVDEVHERSLDTDFLLALLRDVMRIRKDLKVVLMSATLDAKIFLDYFGGTSHVGQVHIEGRTFPVQDHYLDEVVRLTGNAVSNEDLDTEDIDVTPFSAAQGIRRLGMGINYELISSLVRRIDQDLGSKSGGILIFLPGTLEIDRCLKALQTLSFAHGLPLHASLTPDEQRRVFVSAPHGKRKVIAATNVAETSITIQDIVAVIDTGRVKETNYDPKDGIVRLEEVWASHAACKQRRGRAGRVRAGSCYKLFTRNVEEKMASRPEPEIRRIPLEQLCLSVKATDANRDVASFLRQTLTPPDDRAIDVAMLLLHKIGALDNGQLTGLGRYLAMIPADLRCAKLLVYGSIFSCLEPCLTFAARMTLRSPFVSPLEKREEAKMTRSAFSEGHGDLLVDLAAYEAWAEKASVSRFRDVQRWCSDNFLTHQTLRDIASVRSQLLNSLKDASIVPIDYHANGRSTPGSYSIFNEQSDNHILLRALIAGSLNPQIARIEFPDRKFAPSMGGAVEIDPEARTIKYFIDQDNGRVFVHPSSILFDAQAYSGSAAYLSYFSKMATSKTFIRDLTPFSPYALLLFGGPITLDTHGSGLRVDGWLRLRGWARIGVLVSRLRILLDETLRRRFEESNPSSSSSTSSTTMSSNEYSDKKADSYNNNNDDHARKKKDQDRVIGIVQRLVEFNGLDQ